LDGWLASNDKIRVVVMARMEMNAVPASLVIPAEVSAEAYYELGLMHASGRAGAVDLVKAQTWFNVAFARGCARAAAHRQELALEMDRDQIAAALREARAFLTRH
jgi:TPR repeat protein